MNIYQKICLVVVVAGGLSLTSDTVEAAEAVSTSGAFRTAFVQSTPEGAKVTGQLVLPEYGGLAWPNHYHVQIIGDNGKVLAQQMYRHSLSAPKGQSRARSKPYQIHVKDISPESINKIRAVRVTTSHANCS